MKYTTTFEQIIGLYARAAALLTQPDGMSAADQQEYADIRVTLDQLWDRQRAELVRAVSGPPVLIGGGTPEDQQTARARGIIAGGAR